MRLKGESALPGKHGKKSRAENDSIFEERESENRAEMILLSAVKGSYALKTKREGEKNHFL